MSKRHRHKPAGRAAPPTASVPVAARKKTVIAVVFIVGLLTALAVWWSQHQRPMANAAHSLASSNAAASAAAAPRQTNTVAQSVMVTVELDFGATPPRLQDVVKEIERRYEPADGSGRTFAILDADGSIMANGRWHLQMHVSMEKPGAGALIFRRTGEILWQSAIVPAPTGPPPPKQLTILMADGNGQSVMLDGSKGATRALDSPLHNSPLRVRDAWPDGAEREFTFLYSVCGCPVKAQVRRAGETTMRTSERPVMFPDDPEAMNVIRSLMGWSEVR